MKNKLLLSTIIATTILSTACQASVNLTVKPNTTSTFTGNYVGAFADFTVNVTNTSPQTQSYSYTATLCPALNKCETQTQSFTLVSSDSFIKTFRLGTNVKYSQPKVYDTRAKLVVNGFEQSEKEAIGTITVYQK